MPGSPDVINRIETAPLEDDAPVLIEEAVWIALEKDALVDAAQIRVGVRGRVVRLIRLVRSEAVRGAAEADAWYVFGVDSALNEIEVGAS